MNPLATRLHYFAPHGNDHARDTLDVDLCVYGGTSGGITAAVQARRDGLNVAVLENSNHVGGLSASGLGLTDFGNKDSLGGLAREFYHAVGRHYGEAEEWRFEPHVAERVFENWLREHEIPVYRREYLESVRLQGRRIEAIRLLSGLVVRARVFIDATYEGDLLAAAGVSHRVGREDNAVYGETINGMVIRQTHQFNAPVDPWRVEGAPGSGLLPGIEAVDDYAPGRGDERIQAYNFRMCLTNVADNRRAFERPLQYDQAEYELLARYFRTGWRDVFAKFDSIRGGKTDTNNHGAVSTDFIGRNHRWPRATFAERERLFQAHVTYQKGLQWFLANDPEVPADLRNAYGEWGLARDEFVETEGWPHALYVREARRMLGDYVMTEHDCRGTRRVEDPIAFGAYGMDSHNCRRLVREGRVWNEGDVQAAGFKPYPISFRALLPRRGECENLVVPTCVSASHIAYGSIRMEPVFMALGQSAAIIAAQALQENAPTQELGYAGVREALESAGQVVELPIDKAVENELV
ncbi:MAG TPA: FAD-dependent oxidoreductase [Opitutaceae bacterium]|nr:FAD-dependent oxidoreductase [Opitutaceae bacterium]